MSAENFHTIKKLPPSTLIVEPPPEFADTNFNSKFPIHHITASTPTTVIRTTHIQSYASRLTANIIAKAIRTFDRRNLATKEIYCEKHAAAKLKKQHQRALEYEYLRKKRFVANGYSIYGSDSYLDSYNKRPFISGKNSNSNINIVEPDDDIYDEPNTEYDVIYKDNKDTVLCTKRIIRSLEKKKMDSRREYCNTDDLYYEKFKSKSCNTASTSAVICGSNGKFQSNSFQKKFDKFLRSKFLTNNLTPTTTTSSIFYSFCRTGTNNSIPCNPNSKSSLNSRLSSSHNSLTVPTNKADDSIFITQAMSHDQLGHNIEMSDFYNVPMDSDIYTLPIDVIHQQEQEEESRAYRNRHRALSDNNLLGSTTTRSHKFHRSKNKRSKRKKRSSDIGHEGGSRKTTKEVSSVSHEYNRVTSDKGKPKHIQTSIVSNNISAVTIENSAKVRTSKGSIDMGKTVKGDSNNNSSKYECTASVKKSQFSINLNLKQKFCSIFRFRKSHQSPTRNLATSQEPEKKVNLSTRALPPLPPPPTPG
jgi:hypothetical protein